MSCICYALYTEVDMILFFQSYDGGFGLMPGLESHGELSNISSNYWFMFCQLCVSRAGVITVLLLVVVIDF